MELRSLISVCVPYYDSLHIFVVNLPLEYQAKESPTRLYANQAMWISNCIYCIEKPNKKNSWMINVNRCIRSLFHAYTPPLHSIGMPAKKHAKQTPAVTRRWWLFRCGHFSVTARHSASMPPNCDPMPNINIITKNRTAHNCGNGINSTASGYALYFMCALNKTKISSIYYQYK